MTEKTIVRAVEDITHNEAEWLGDCNVVLVGKHLSEEQVDLALANLSAKWRRSFLRVVA